MSCRHTAPFTTEVGANGILRGPPPTPPHLSSSWQGWKGEALGPEPTVGGIPGGHTHSPLTPSPFSHPKSLPALARDYPPHWATPPLVAAPDCLSLGEMSPLCRGTQNKTGCPSCPTGPIRFTILDCSFFKKALQPKRVEFSGKSMAVGVRQAWVQIQTVPCGLGRVTPQRWALAASSEQGGPEGEGSQGWHRVLICWDVPQTWPLRTGSVASLN